MSWRLLAVFVVLAVSLAAWAWNHWSGGDQDVASQGTGEAGTAATRRDDWTPLFNGRDLSGLWKLKSPPGEWTVEDGVLVGRIRDGTSDPSSYLLTERNDYANFECRAEVRISNAGNSGVFFRCNSESSLPQGLEAHLGTVNCGNLHRTWSHGELPVKTVAHPIVLPPNRWATVEISARGSHIVIRVDGMTTADVTEHLAAPASGYLALQVFDVGTEVSVRKWEIRELP